MVEAELVPPRHDERLQQALEALSASSSPTDRADRLQDLRQVYERLGFWRDALETEQAWLQQQQHSNEAEPDSWVRQGRLHLRLGERLKAQRLYDQALERYEDLLGPGFHPRKGLARIAKAGLAWSRGDGGATLEALHEAEQHFVQDEGLHPDLVVCWQHQGKVHREMENFEAALERYQACRELVPETQGLRLDIADMHAALGQIDEALEMYQALLEEDPEMEGHLLHTIGKLHAQKGEHEVAKTELQQAIDIKRKVLGSSHPEVGTSLSALGAVHAVTNEPRLALDCFQEALLIARMHADDEGDSTVMMALRNIALVRGD